MSSITLKATTSKKTQREAIKNWILLFDSSQTHSTRSQPDLYARTERRATLDACDVLLAVLCGHRDRRLFGDARGAVACVVVVVDLKIAWQSNNKKYILNTYIY